MNELTIIFDGKSKQPLYEQIYEYLKREMREGTIAPGERLPSTRALSRFLQVSRSTVDLAYSQLLAEGYLESVPCRGYYAADVKLLCHMEMPEKTTSAEERTEEQIYPYDFALNGIDSQGSPANLWRKISKRILLEDTGELFRQGKANGDASLREAVCRYLYQARGVHCRKEQIVVGAGNDYLLMILGNLIGRDAVIGMENPTYKSAYDTFSNLGYALVSVDMDAEGMQVKSLEQTGARIAYVMPSHQFPTGVIMPIARRLALLEWAGREEERYIIEDDYDSEFRYKGKPIPALRGIDGSDKVIYLGTFSKSISPATRISYMVLPEKILEKAANTGYFYAQTVSRVDQKIIEVLLNEGYFERHLNRMRALYKNKREYLLSLLTGMDDIFSISGENAGLHIVLDFRTGWREEDILGEAGKYGIRLYGITDYLTAPQKLQCRATLLMGYATISETDMEKAAAILKNKVFPALAHKYRQ